MAEQQVSLVVPTWNEYPQIRGLLKSLRSQKISPKEVILVDKYSTDSTVTCARSYGADVIYDTGSVAHARNVGIEKCSGEIVAFTEGDVILSPDWVSKIALTFGEKPGLLAFSGPGYPYNQGSVPPLVQIEYYLYNSFRKVMNSFGLFMCSGYNLAVRRDVFKNIRFPDIVPNDDGLFGRQVAKLGPTLFSLDHPVLISPRRFKKMGFLQANLYYLFMLENLSPAFSPLVRKMRKRASLRFHEVRA